MSAVPMLAGVGLMMVCCSSSSVASMVGGETIEETKPGAGDPIVIVGDKTPDQTLMISQMSDDVESSPHQKHMFRYEVDRCDKLLDEYVQIT